MDQSYPIFTVEVECQDCYKCVRECPSKGIRVQNGHASIMPELCATCGHCVVICPGKAKKIRDDLGRARLLLKQKSQVIASLAPSWVTEFKNISPETMSAAIKALGFSAVSETALGAQEVSAGLLAEFKQAQPGLYISSACPSVVEFINKQLPEFHDKITGVTSPLLAHSRLLRRLCGDEIGIVFFGPCVAKKLEADRNRDVLDLALTFQDLRRWLEIAEINLAEIDSTGSDFFPYRAEEGALYPIDGGMVETMNSGLRDLKIETLSISGLGKLQYYLSEFDSQNLDTPVFLEALACEGGCINGPGRSRKEPGLLDRLKVRSSANVPKKIPRRKNSVEINLTVPANRPEAVRLFSQDEMEEALAKIGKYAPEDELNCGGCGYNTCRNFARALMTGKAEPSMCVSFMRKKAQNKANAILRCMPSAAVIADSDLRVIECNRHFAKMFGEDSYYVFESLSNLEGAYLEKILPFANLFRTALRTGDDIFRSNFRVGEKLFNISLFTIEPQQVVGAIIQDATAIEMHREAIASKANEVLKKNLNTVQNIARLLGEHMADTEIVLRSIAKGFPNNNPSFIKAQKAEEKSDE